MSEGVREWGGDGVDDWVSEWVGGWVSEWLFNMSIYICVFKPKRHYIKPPPKAEMKGKGSGELIEKIKTINLKDDKIKNSILEIFFPRYIIMGVSGHVVLSKSKEQVYEPFSE